MCLVSGRRFPHSITYLENMLLSERYIVFFFCFNSKVCSADILKIYYSLVKHISMKFHFVNEYSFLRFCRRKFTLAVPILDSKLNLMTEVVFAICVKTMILLSTIKAIELMPVLVFWARSRLLSSLASMMEHLVKIVNGF